MQQITMGEVTPEYQAFVDKFKPKLTTDDCYTPPLVYEAVADWTAQTYGLDKSTFVRPFWPGGDYKRFDYPEGCVVVDNPPFSTLQQIVLWYCAKGMRFMLFNQHTTALRRYAIDNRCTVLATGATVVYANGALVRTSFLTNLEQEYIVRSAPDLTEAVEAANDRAQKEARRQMPVYAYPDHIVTSAMVGKYSRHGIAFGVRYGEGVRVDAMDRQRPKKKSIYGAGLLVSSRAAAERAAAERAAAERAAAERAAAERAAAERAAAERARAIVWELSDREREIIREMDARREEE